jgi:hypothetical protein
MKKLLFLMAIAVNFLAAIPQKAEAQTSLTSSVNSLARDTITNTGTAVWSAGPVLYNTAVTIQVDYTKISGTLAGTITPVASNDGTTFYSVSSRVTRDTALAVGNASGGYNYSMPSGWRYYGVQWTGSGTMSGSLVAKLNRK